MSRSTRAAGAAVAAVMAAALLTAAPTHAGDAGIEAQVDSIMELRLDPLDDRNVAATVTTTVGHTRISAPASGGDETSQDFAGPVTAKRVVVHAPSAAQSADATITFGPQGP